MRIVVTGGRWYSDVQTVFRVLDLLSPSRVAEGGAKGADELAREWCAVRKIDCSTYHADWSAHGDAAGPIRNRTMLEEERPDAVIAFPGNAGTHDCVARARSMGLVVLEVTP